jgi:hypothetical protein
MRRPSAEILQAIAKALRISAETLYVKAGILEERDDATDPVTSLLRDLTISDKQKQVLIEIYQSFRHENELQGGASAPAVTARKVAALREGKTTAPKRPSRAKPTAKAQSQPKAKAQSQSRAPSRAAARKATSKKTTRKSARR